MASGDDFVGAKIGYGTKALHLTVEEIKKNGGGRHAFQWRNRRPICPYGCDEEGSLMEIIMKDGKAIGIYTHSESVKPFTADLQMSPKPTSRKIQIGPDGEPQIVEDN